MLLIFGQSLIYWSGIFTGILAFARSKGNTHFLDYGHFNRGKGLRGSKNVQSIPDHYTI